MGKLKGFLEIDRQAAPKRPAQERLADWNEVYLPYATPDLRAQGARCMDCGIPFCHQGCPLGNLIPDWNDLVYRDKWRSAIDRLHKTNNFPEWTGRLCPAPCEGSCVLAIDGDAVTIKAGRARDCRARFRRRLGSSRNRRRFARGKSVGGRRFGSGGARRRRSAQPGRPLGDGLREGGPHRRPAALRDPGVQDGEALPRPAE